MRKSVLLNPVWVEARVNEYIQCLTLDIWRIGNSGDLLFTILMCIDTLL